MVSYYLNVQAENHSYITSHATCIQSYLEMNWFRLVLNNSKPALTGKCHIIIIIIMWLVQWQTLSLLRECSKLVEDILIGII